MIRISRRAFLAAHFSPRSLPAAALVRRAHAASIDELDATRRNSYGDPLPSLAFRDAPESAALRGYSESTIQALFARMARAGGGSVLPARGNGGDWQDHPSGGCRIGGDPTTSVVDGWGRTHDHENLFVVGAPTCVSGSCANGTLSFCALALRAATEIAR